MYIYIYMTGKGHKMKRYSGYTARIIILFKSY